jgi:hypothetical protein
LLTTYFSTPNFYKYTRYYFIKGRFWGEILGGESEFKNAIALMGIIIYILYIRFISDSSCPICWIPKIIFSV